MNNPFDRAFEATRAADEQARARLAADRAASEATRDREAQLIRSVADPYLRSVAASAKSRLLSLGIPQQRTTDRPPPLEDWQRPTGFSTRTLQWGYWPLGADISPGRYAVSIHPTTHRCLIDDGYFSLNPALPGPRGYELLLSRARFIDPGQPRVETGTGPLYVERGTNRVCLAAEYVHGHHDYRDVDVWEFADYVAKQVYALQQANGR